MFTGLVQHVGQLEKVAFQGEAGRLTLSGDFTSPLEIGESIAVNGACLTLVSTQSGQLVFDVLQETFDKTSLRDKTSGSPLNLERALRMGDAVGGHWVSGHVDGTGTLLRIGDIGRDKLLVVSAKDLVADIVSKGSITIDGVSLTVVDVDTRGGTFSVHIIPHTWNQTALSSLKPGAHVNLETDMIGKYVRAALERQTPPSTATLEKLRNAGYDV